MLGRIRQDLNQALKRRDAATVRVLRMVLAEAHNRRIALGRELEEGEVLEVLRHAVRMREEAAAQFEAGGRADLAGQERAEIAVLQGYLPSMLEGDELAAAVEEAIAETGASSPRQVGQVMGLLMERYRGRIDGRQASELVRRRLGGP